jgi:hypothetical protein
MLISSAITLLMIRFDELVTPTRENEVAEMFR